jgi:hypothetical protein
MPVPRPKILTAVTFDAAANFLFTVSVAGSLDTQKTAVVPAGTYYVAWDGQSDDLIHVLLTQMVAQLAALGSAYYPSIRIDSDNKVVVDFDGTHYCDAAGWENDVSLDHTASTAALVKALGFDNTGDDTSTGTDYPTFTADYQHGYGWYANSDGQLVTHLIEDRNHVVTPQSVSLSGRVTSQNIGERFSNVLELAWLDRGQTYSRGVGYTEAAVYPYGWNVPLECWWREAREGTEFRVYREGRNDTTVFVEIAESEASAGDTMVDSAKAWGTDPKLFAGLVAYGAADSRGSPTRMFIESHSATTLIGPNSYANGRSYVATDTTFYVLDHRYSTYVVDLGKMSEFAPSEHQDEDYYSITIPLLRYES